MTAGQTEPKDARMAMLEEWVLPTRVTGNLRARVETVLRGSVDERFARTVTSDSASWNLAVPIPRMQSQNFCDSLQERFRFGRGLTRRSGPLPSIGL